MEEKLKSLLASWLVFRQKVHVYHWNIKGATFLELHAHFGKFYYEAVEKADSIAERMKQLGMSPINSLKEVTELSQVKDENTADSGTKMLEDLLEALTTLNAQQKELWEMSSDDYVTNDLMVKLSEYTGFQEWLLKSILG